MMLRPVIALTLSLPTWLAAQPAARPMSELPIAGFEDYRTPAGRMEDGVLRVRLEAREAAWLPWGSSGRAVRAHVFAETGDEPRVPGPLIRVRAGTTVVVTLTNTLPDTLVVRGLRGRSGDGTNAFRAAFEGDSLVLAPGATTEARFTPAFPGGYYYYGRTTRSAGTGSTRPLRSGGGPDDALTGALVVDGPDEPPDPGERIFLITQWADSLVPESHRETVRLMVNGRSWPHTERLVYAQGDTVRWRVINQSAVFHPMHLHGFYFTVNQWNRPDGSQILAAGQQRVRVTQAVASALAIRMSFVAHEPGNWLYHCHLMRHMSAMQGPPAGPEAHEHAPAGRTGVDLMAGLVLGFTVTPAAGHVANTSAPRRTHRLHIGKRDGVFGNEPAYAFVLQNGPVPPAPDSVAFPSSPIFLKRGEPSQIIVRNNADVPLGVHWHGLELESWADGVPGWSGGPTRPVSAIAPGDSLVVRMTPPRAGTFMYHVHSEPGHQLSQGLYGQFTVLDSVAHPHPEHDRFFLLGSLGPGADAAPAVNGSLDPRPLQLEVGTTYRLRFMHITPDDNRHVTILDGDSTQTWRIVAYDGADYAPGNVRATPANIRFFDPGTTFDAEFTPAKPGTLTLRIVTEYDAGVAPFRRPVPPRHTMNIPITVIVPAARSNQ